LSRSASITGSAYGQAVGGPAITDSDDRRSIDVGVLVARVSARGARLVKMLIRISIATSPKWEVRVRVLTAAADRPQDVISM
jgi:hypothetical protein